MVRCQVAIQSLKKLISFSCLAVFPLVAIAGVEEGENDNRVEGTVYFDTDSSHVSKKFSDLISKTAAFLKADPKRKIMIEGHTDERASSVYNQGLSDRRSQAVVVELFKAGVDPSQVIFVGRGETEPARKGHSKNAYRHNRRVTLCAEDDITSDDKPVRPISPAVMIDLTPVAMRTMPYPPGDDRFVGVYLDEARFPSFPREEDDGLQWGYDFTAGIRQTEIEYTPGPLGPNARHVSRTSGEVNGSIWLNNGIVPLAIARGNFGMVKDRSYGGGDLTVHLKSTGTREDIYGRSATENTVAYGRVNPVEVGIRFLNERDQPGLSAQVGFIPISYFYESRGFSGDSNGGSYGAGLQLWGTGLHLNAEYSPASLPALRLIGDVEALVGGSGVTRASMFGAELPNERTTESGWQNPFFNTSLTASYTLAKSWVATSQFRFNYLKTFASDGLRISTETSAKIGLTYRPE